MTFQLPVPHVTRFASKTLPTCHTFGITRRARFQSNSPRSIIHGVSDLLSQLLQQSSRLGFFLGLLSLCLSVYSYIFVVNCSVVAEKLSLTKCCSATIHPRVYGEIKAYR